MNMPFSRSIHVLVFLLGCLFAAQGLAQEDAPGSDDRDSRLDDYTFYLDYSAGVSVVPNQSLKRGSSTSAGYSGSVRPQAGYVLGAAFGAKVVKFMGADIRTEAAIGFRQADVKAMNVGGPNVPQEASSANGDISLFTAMLNGYVDYDFGIKVVPYLGAGIGYGLVNLQAQNAGSLLKVTDRASAFVWNLMAGGSYPYSETVDIVGGYRYIATDDFTYNARILNVGQRYLESEFDAHEVTLGIRVKF